MPLKKNQINKLFYSIGEVAGIFEVNTSLIRFWEKEFEIIQPKKNKKGNRLFTPKDLNHFEIIFRLVKHQGYTLEGAKKALKEQKNELQNKNLLLNRLKSIKTQLQLLKEEI